MKNLFRKAVSAFLTFAVISASSIGSLDALAAVSGVWPTQPEYKNITTYFDAQRNVSNSSAYHNAIDIEAAYNTNIYAAYPGTVKYAGWLDGYGYIVILRHDDLGVYTFYAHASSLTVSAGNTVAQGDIIAKVGSTGNSSGNHLHFGVSSAIDATGYPTVTFYDPLSYFTYSNVTASGGAASAMSKDYAGTYNTTSSLTTYLNIRSGAGTGYSIIGRINAGTTNITVTEADGQWAHVDYNGVNGYCSMDYLQKAQQPANNTAAAAPAVDYSGTYATKGVTTYINIRSGKGTEYSVIGKIPAHADNIKVLDGDGKWAHIEYGGVTGYCSMDYIQRFNPPVTTTTVAATTVTTTTTTTTAKATTAATTIVATAAPAVTTKAAAAPAKTDSNMNIASVIAPMGQVEYKKTVNISGTINSAVNISRVWGGVYDENDKASLLYAEAAPNAKTYDLKTSFAKNIDLSKLDKGSYVYHISAEDENGKIFELVRTEFSIIAQPTQERPAVKEVKPGDLNSDGNVTIADGLLLQGFLLNNGSFNEAQFKASDINGDSTVNVFDMILLKKLLTDNT